MHSDGMVAEYMAAPQDICVKLPDNASLEVGALLEAAGVAVHAIQRADYAVAGRAVLVSGGGPVGLVVAYLAQLMGAAHVIVVEPNPYRRAQAQKIGAIAMPPGEEVVELCRELTGRRGGFDVAAHINKKGITLRGIFGRRLWDTWEQTMLLLDSGRLDLEWLITHRMPLSQVDQAVDLLTGEACKVLLVPGLH